MLKRILIANRGEIAVRIIRACRELGLAAIAVYSDVDRASEHVLLADEAYPIGPAPATESYLRIDKLIEVARRAHADGLHPGYGFLAENPKLARACAEAGIVWIGPPPTAMELMGSKTEARRAAESAGVPVVPGTRAPLASAAEAKKLAAEWGYPVLLKAVAGGGGKGMRRVDSRDQMAAAFRDAESEALNAFADPSLFVEKYLERPRHIEIQVLGDNHGHLIHLGERECSLQRRHQKVVEECPSPVMTPDLRAQMGKAAVKLARAAGYANAGTVEFLVVPSTRSRLGFDYFFLEMNTRLQVEHPVTEVTTGLDLVQGQIRVASGERLPWRQEDISWRGHAIECRIYAEDAENNFFPCPGTITRLERPAGPGVRLDGYVYEGWNVPIHYDPLLAKLVVWAGTRAEAVARLRRALDEYIIGGIQTNLPFFRRLVARPEFTAGELDTELIDRLLRERASELEATRELPPRTINVAALAVAVKEASASRNGARPAAPSSGWKQAARREGLRAPLGKRR
ncbi:MAG TPA: acetyl-CoA carboxylase biotin carboxylase subunit [Candidatus Xenobia bacterium]|nr:acetyl-CoA carboxylase biotin carboxylase subunit [Candidatus Xenobia bacterium]